MSLLQMRNEELLDVIELFARGYTIRFIEDKLKRRAAEKGRSDLVPTPQQLLTLAVRYADDVEAVRGELAKRTFEAGLARKEERVRRLSEAAEAIEDQVMSGINLKATETYRKILQSVHEEVEPLKLVVISPDDPWAQLLSNLKETRDSSTQGEETSDSQSSLPSTLESEAGQAPPKSTRSLNTLSAPVTNTPTPNKEESSISTDA